MRTKEYRLFTFYVQGVNIDNVPLEDIAAFVEDFAKLLGKDAVPKFHSIRRGSLIVGARVPRDREVVVVERTFLLRTGGAPLDAVQAHQRISNRLGEYQARSARILDDTKAKILEFPIQRPFDQLPSLTKSGSLQGKIIRLGGTKAIVPVELQDVDGHVYLCLAKRDIAKELAKNMFEPTIRVFGTGRWHRREDGLWYVEDFQISRFEQLEDDTLEGVVEQLQEIPAPWKDQDVLIELERLRHGED